MGLVAARRASAQKESSCAWALTCFIAISPILSECLRMLSRKSFRSDMERSLISSRRVGMLSTMTLQKR